MMSIEYIAGFFDGEGTAGYYQRRDHRGYQYRLVFINTHLPTLTAIRDTLGTGRIIPVARVKRHYKRCWHLVIAGRLQVLSVAEILYPFLMVKQQAVASLIKRARAFIPVGTAGEWNGNAKLTMVQVAEIRRRYALKNITQSALAKEYGVHQTTISWLTRGDSWV